MKHFINKVPFICLLVLCSCTGGEVERGSLVVRENYTNIQHIPTETALDYLNNTLSRYSTCDFSDRGISSKSEDVLFKYSLTKTEVRRGSGTNFFELIEDGYNIMLTDSTRPLLALNDRYCHLLGMTAKQYELAVQALSSLGVAFTQ